MRRNIIMLLIITIILTSGAMLYVERYLIQNVYNFYRSNPDVEFYFDNYGKKITFQSEELTIVGTLYDLEARAGNKTMRPGIILVHGETSVGRKLPVYRILAKKLAERGYIILTYDRRGIGESDNPERVDLIEAWNESNEVVQAVSYLSSLENIDKSRIYAIGHSGGAFPVMQGGLEDKRIKKIAVIGPPRRIEERILNESAPDRQYLLERKSAYRGLKEPMPLETFLSIILELKILYDTYKVSDHIPIFLIDGELESREDRLYLMDYFNGLKEPKKYQTINNTEHYLNTTGQGDLMLYNNKVIDETVNSLDNWFSSG